jgi:serine/threonine protein kinase
MEYITSQGFVHRDLALRNILVESSIKVRIADLGLTRGVNKDANYYYVLNTSSKNWLPLLYYPPEFFTNDFKYDKYGDVWSYGVTCFELWSKGQTPYAAQHVTKSAELIEFLKRSTLDIPPDTPDVFEHVMKKCWLPKRERWNFTEVLTYLKSNAQYTNPRTKKKAAPSAYTLARRA